MSIALDSHYTIGRLHRVCQDYGCHGLMPVPYTILSDGCSAAPDSDVGARLLVLNARHLLPQFALGHPDESKRMARHQRLGRRIIRRAARQVQEMGVDVAVLDATLLIAWCDDSTVYVHLYGDGCITTRHVNGDITVIQVEYAENAPYYLSYLLDHERWLLYQEMIGDTETAQTINYLHEAGSSGRIERFDTPTVFSFNRATFPTVMVATDGLHSFVNAESGNRLNTWEVAKAMLDFGDLNGDFVGSQMRSALTEYSKNMVINLDDLCIGAFVETN